MADVRLPNGNVITGVPEGATDEEIRQEAIAMGLARAEEFPEPAPVAPVGEEDFLGSGVIEPAATFASGLVAEPAAGIAGLGAMGINEIYNFFKGGGRPSAEVGEDVINAMRNTLTYQPETQSGIESMQAIGEALAPVGEFIGDVERGAGDIAYEAGGQSPLAGALGTTAPTAAMTAMGLRPFRSFMKQASGLNRVAKAVQDASQGRAVNKMIKRAAPSAPQLKKVSGNIYDALDESGAVVKSTATDSLTNSIMSTMTKEGFHPRLHQPVAVALSELRKNMGNNLPVGKIDQLRKFAQAAAKNIDPDTKRLGTIMIGKIDDFMDNMKQSDFAIGAGDVGKQYQLARNLWGRGKKSNLLDDAVTKASDQASGFENGIRIQFRHILNSDKKRKFFTADEIKSMRKVVQGTSSANIAQFIGKFGFDIGRTPNIVGGSIGTAAGGQLLGAGGMVAVPVIGTVARQLAKRLTQGNAEFANAIVRAGSDGKVIVREYLKRVPKVEQNPKELAQLLMRPEIAIKDLQAMPLSSIPKKQKMLIKDAVLYADIMRQGQADQSSDESSMDLPQQRVQ